LRTRGSRVEEPAERFLNSLFSILDSLDLSSSLDDTEIQ